MKPEHVLLAYTLRLGDNALILSQRMVERVAAEPELESELSNANFALDYIGQARLFYSHAGELEGNGRSEDDLAFLRDEHEFQNLLLLEQPNGHFGDSLIRQYLFEAFYLRQLDALCDVKDEGLRSIAERARKEVRYHLRYASQWVIRLGDGTELSHQRMQDALQSAWRFTGEMFAADEVDDLLRQHFNGPDLAAIALDWEADVSSVLAEATLTKPEASWMASGGKQGVHSEHFGFMLAEMQYLQRSHPGASW